jgi:hypothetical protein
LLSKGSPGHHSFDCEVSYHRDIQRSKFRSPVFCTAADDDEELVEWEEYEEEVEIEEGEEYDKVVYVEETEEEPLPYPFSMAGTVSMKQFKLWPEQWPEIRELQEKANTSIWMFLVSLNP